jgi:diguanylate cyclase (GGDEF)-like protein
MTALPTPRLRDWPRWPERLWRWCARAPWWWAGLLTALLLGASAPTGLKRLDLLTYDLLLPDAQPSPQAPVVIAIDDQSLEQLGSWPWPRALHARLIDRLTQAGASSIGIAVLFADPDWANPASDAALATAMARHGRVVLAVAPARQQDGSIATAPLLPALAGQPAHPWLGHVDVEMDLDGQSRSLFLHAGLHQPSLPALALAVRELAQPQGRGHASLAAPPQASAPAGTGGWVRRGEVFPPRVALGRAVPFIDALESPALADQVRGRSVFIGVTASGLGGSLATPLAPAAHTPLPALAMHAMVFDALQSDRLITPAPPWMALLLALAAISSLALWPRQDGRDPALVRVLLAGALLAVPVLASGALLLLGRLWLPPTLAVVALGVALAFREAGKLHASHRKLQRSRQHAQAALQAIDDAVLTVEGPRHTVRFANPTALLQAAPRPLEGVSVHGAYPLDAASDEQLRIAIGTSMANAHSVHLRELLRLDMPEDPRVLRATVNPLRGPTGGVDGAVLVFTDVTGALAAAREREHAATHDALTGLPNRLMLQERLQLTLSRVQRQGSTAAILFVDLDRFKHINDTLGHHTGDEVLKVLARRLRDLCRDTDTVARWGGDEFVLILEDVAGPEGAALAAAKIVDALSWDIALGPEFNDRRLPSAGSVGVVMVPRDGTQIDDLLSKADMAMYRAKAQPKASFHIWAADINARMHDRLAMEVDLRQSLRAQALVLHYQPQYALGERKLVGMEALMRWQRRPGELLQPAEFIHVAEESGLILDMGAWAVLQAARQVAAWAQAGLPPTPVAVNVSGRQCMTRDLLQVVRAALRETGIAPPLLRLEITESTAMTEGDHVIGLLHEIRALGVRLSLDDFGTGYSSLAYLKHFPIDEIKIDGSFVRALPDSRDDAAIVHATIALAQGLELQVVAEGVETEAQASFLAERGCNAGQGFLFGQPEPVEHATSRLA